MYMDLVGGYVYGYTYYIGRCTYTIPIYHTYYIHTVYTMRMYYYYLYYYYYTYY
jgi:hypothetical protein